MIWKIIKVLCYILAFAGVLFILGTVGADDYATLNGQEIFSFSELALRCAIGLGTVIFGVLGARYAKEEARCRV